jgi:transcriptional regulator with XRE-family HTH domain
MRADPAWFAGRLRELREQAGLSRKDLADRAGLSEGGVRDLEQDHRRPSWETVLTLCSALGVDANAFAQQSAQTGEKPKRGRPKKSGQAEQDEADRALKDAPATKAETDQEPPAKKSGKRGGKRKGG